MSKYLALLIFALFVSEAGHTAPRKTVTVGAIAPLSGDFAATGKEVTDGIQLAVEDFNKSSDSITLELKLEDDRFDSKTALSAYRHLSQVENIQALLNLSSPSIGAIYNDVVKAGYPVIQLGEQPVEPVKDNVFQISPGSIAGFEDFGRGLGTRGYRKSVVLSADSATIWRFVDAVERGLGTKMEREGVLPDMRDFRSVLSKIVRQNPDGIVLFLFPEQGALAVLQLLELGYAPEKIALPLFQVGYSDYKRLIPDLTKIERSVTAAFKDPSSIFVEKFKKRFGYAPGSWAGFGYDGLQLLASSYDADRTTWSNKISQATLNGVSGKVEFDAVGVRTWVGDVLTVGDYIRKLKT